MFWIVVAVVVLVGFAVAWVTSGRKRPVAGTDHLDPRQEQAKAHVQRTDLGGPDSGPAHF